MVTEQGTGALSMRHLRRGAVQRNDTTASHCGGPDHHSPRCSPFPAFVEESHSDATATAPETCSNVCTP